MIIYPVLAAGDESDRSIAIDQISTVFANEKEGLIEQEIVYLINHARRTVIVIDFFATFALCN